MEMDINLTEGVHFTGYVLLLISLENHIITSRRMDWVAMGE